MEASGNSTPAPAADTPAADVVAAAPAAPPVARSIGERLKAGRERAGLSIAAAGEKLHLDPKVIEALEADRFAEVGASVYVRGHLRRYGDFVGENGTELVSMYGTRETRAATPDLTQVPHPERRADPRRLVTPLVVLGSATVLLGAIWWVLSGSRSTNTVTPGSAANSMTVADEPGSPPPMAQAPAVTATPVTLSNAPAPVPTTRPSPAVSGASAATTTQAPPAVREAPARETRLRLELTNDSWVEVYDSSGQRLYYDVATGGSVQSVSGRGPLRVVLENAAGVTVEVDGQPREIPDSAVEGERARFVVNRSGSLSRSR